MESLRLAATHCRNRGCLKVVLGPTTADEHVIRGIEHAGFRFSLCTNTVGGEVIEFYTDLYTKTDREPSKA